MLTEHDLTEAGAEVALERVLVLRHRVVLASQGCLEDIPGVFAREGVLERDPPAVQGSAHRSALVDVVAVVVTEIDDLAAEARALFRKTLQRGRPLRTVAVPQLLCGVGKTALAVFQRLDQFLGDDKLSNAGARATRAATLPVTMPSSTST